MFWLSQKGDTHSSTLHPGGEGFLHPGGEGGFFTQEGRGVSSPRRGGVSSPRRGGGFRMKLIHACVCVVLDVAAMATTDLMGLAVGL